jgi:hypothetical protein
MATSKSAGSVADKLPKAVGAIEKMPMDSKESMKKPVETIANKGLVPPSLSPATSSELPAKDEVKEDEKVDVARPELEKENVVPMLLSEPQPQPQDGELGAWVLVARGDSQRALLSCVPCFG